MTVSTLTNSIVYQGNGATTAFTFPFPAVAASYLDVTYTDPNGGVTLIPKGQYSVQLNAPIAPNPTEIGGTVTYPLTGSPIPIGSTLTIARDLPGTQSTSLANQSTLYQPVIEAALDYITMLTQQNSNLVDNAVLFPLSDPTGLNHTLPPVANRSGQFVTFDGAGNVTVALGVAGGATISVFMQPFCNSSTLASAQNFLGINAAGYVPVGAEFEYAGMQAPQYYFMELGQAVSRTGFPELFNAVCPLYASAQIQTGNLWVILPPRPDGLAATTGIRVGIPAEAPGVIPAGTTVVSIHPSNPWIQLSAAPTGNGSTIRLCPYGNGDGSTTFSLPDSRGLVVAGLDPQNATGRLTAGVAGGVSGSAVGNYGGEQYHVITPNEMPVHQHAYYVYDQTHTHYEMNPLNVASSASIIGYSGGYVTPSQGTAVTYSGANLLCGSSYGANDFLTNNIGGSQAHNTVQPTHIRLKIIYAGRATF
jgi:microcystin-dependent protein